MRLLLCAAAASAVLGLTGCEDEIIVIARPCVVSGAIAAGSTNAQPNPTNAVLFASDVDNLVFDTFNEVNTKIWSAAKIGFLGCCQEIPVIPDPDTTIGKRGEIVISLHGSSEMDAVYTSCRNAWNQKGFANGRVVIIARDMLYSNGGRSAEIGIAYPGATDSKLCSTPRNLVAGDVDAKYAIVIEQAAFGYTFNYRTPIGTPHDTFIRTLGHELGHTLLLWHGDGVDNDNDAAVPPAPGARTFDSVCDPGEVDTALSLMSWSYPVNLTPLQIELAREAAVLIPGSAGGPP